MKKIVLPFLGILFVTTVTAQEIPERKDEGYRPHSKHHRGMTMEQLNLTQEQKNQFKAQREDFKKQMEELKKNDGITVKEQREKMETLRKENKAKTESILTADQKARLEKMKTDAKTKRESMHKKRGERMKDRLGLTDEQSVKLKKSRGENMQKMKVIRENKDLNDEQKKEQLKALHEKQKENMKTILTEEQLKKLNEQKHHKPKKDTDKKPSLQKTI